MKMINVSVTLGVVWSTLMVLKPSMPGIMPYRRIKSEQNFVMAFSTYRLEPHNSVQ